MENGEYYMGIGKNEDLHSPKLVLGYMFDGARVEIYKTQETFIVINTKTEKYLMCLSIEHAHYIFKECVRMLAPEVTA